MGHYKNSLRRRKRSPDDGDFANVNSTAMPSNDSQTAAIVVTQVTGSHPNDDEAISTTEPPRPVDQSEETSPQTFAPKLAERYYDYDEEKVSRRQRESKEDEPYNSEKFIADDDSKEEEGEPSDSAQLVGHAEQESVDNEELVGEQELGQPDAVDENDADRKAQLHRDPDEGSVEERTGAGAADVDGNGDERDEAVSGRSRENDSGRLDWISNYNEHLTDSKELKGDNGSRTSGNLKEQFEHIPLDYKHDDVQEKQSKEDEELEKYKYQFNIDLGDTTVELDNITLPESVFGFYKSEFTDKHRKDDEKNAKLLNEDDSDDDEAEVEGEEEEDEDTEKNKSSEKNEQKEDDVSVSPFRFLGDDEDFVPPYADFDARPKEVKDYSKEDDSEYLHDYIGDENLRGAVAALLEKSKKTEKEAGSDDDPKYSYSWTLEYGQPS